MNIVSARVEAYEKAADAAAMELLEFFKANCKVYKIRTDGKTGDQTMEPRDCGCVMEELVRQTGSPVMCANILSVCILQDRDFRLGNEEFTIYGN